MIKFRFSVIDFPIDIVEAYQIMNTHTTNGFVMNISAARADWPDLFGSIC